MKILELSTLEKTFNQLVETLLIKKAENEHFMWWVEDAKIAC